MNAAPSVEGEEERDSISLLVSHSTKSEMAGVKEKASFVVRSVQKTISSPIEKR